LINAAILTIFGSEHIHAFGFPEQSDYYMFLAGVYHQERGTTGAGADDGTLLIDGSYAHDSWGYYLLFGMCLAEYICIQWLKHRFGCSIAALDTIKKLFSQSQELERLIQNANNKI